MIIEYYFSDNLLLLHTKGELVLKSRTGYLILKMLKD